jgi:pimeloyl-ACP methyl ester carboxylesterase
MDDRPPLILLHAFPLDSQLFRRMPAPPGIRLHTPDLRGFGRTPLAPPGEPVPAPDMDVLAGDVIAGLDAARDADTGVVAPGDQAVAPLLAPDT